MIIINDYSAYVITFKLQSYKFAFATDRVHNGKPSPLFTTLAGLSAIIINNGCSSGPFKCYGTRGGGVYDQAFRMYTGQRYIATRGPNIFDVLEQ